MGVRFGGFPPPTGDAVVGDVGAGKKFSSKAVGFGKIGTGANFGNATISDVALGKTFSSANGTLLSGNGTNAKRKATGTITADGSGIVTVTGLAFRPSLVFLWRTSGLTASGRYSMATLVDAGFNVHDGAVPSTGYSAGNYYNTATAGTNPDTTTPMTSGGFTFATTFGVSQTFSYIAFE